MIFQIKQATMHSIEFEYMEVWVNKIWVKALAKQTLASFKGVAETLATR
jgi:hypothetical protein